MIARTDFPALDGRTVTEAHAAICRDFGHARRTVDGRVSGVCPRCGDIVAPTPRTLVDATSVYPVVRVFVRSDDNGHEPINGRPAVGAPATIHLVNDTVAAVVVKVNKKSISVAPVKVDESTTVRINDEREPFPVLAMPGILTEIVGKPMLYSIVELRDGTRVYRHGSVSVTLGKSVRIVDYRY